MVNATSAGYADVNGIGLYHEIYGEGEPLVFLHGGLTTIGEMQQWIGPLATSRRVIAVEMQGHGHTADIDRPLSFATLADDIAALLDHLQLPSADIAGHSFGGACGIRMAVQHPNRVRRLVVISSPHARRCWYPEAQEGMRSVNASMAGNLMRTPTGKLSTQWPDPQRFAPFLTKLGALLGEDYDWSADIAKLPMPVLLIFADNDSIPQKHIAEFFALLGGGVKEPGWRNTQLSKSRLSVVTGYSHYNLHSAPEVPPIIATFLADPLSNGSEGASAASQIE